MEFSRRGPAGSDEDDGHCFPDPPPHSLGDPMLVIRDALLSQLQKDRLRQDIIMAELAKIERDMAMRTGTAAPPGHVDPCDGTAAADVERATPWPFGAEQFMPQRRGPVGEEHDVKLLDNDGRHSSAESISRKPVMEDRAGVCLKSYEGDAGQQNAAFDEKMRPDSSETVPSNRLSPAVKWELTGITIPVKKPKTPMKCSCALCQVELTSERGLLDHYTGKRHQSNVTTLESRIKVGQKVKNTEEPSPGTEHKKTSSIKWTCRTCQASGTCESDLEAHLKGSRHQQNIAAQCKGGSDNDMPTKVAPQEEKLHENNVYVPQQEEQPPSIWSCSICQAICTCESDLENHLKGRRHLANVAKAQAQHAEIKTMARDSQKPKQHPNNVPQLAEKTAPRWTCSICQAHCTCESDLKNHRRGRRHQLNIQALRENLNQPKKNPSQVAKNQKTLSNWDCSICHAKCNSELQFENHCRSRMHQQKMEAILSEGNHEKGLKVNELPSYVPICMNASSEKLGQTASNFCEVCNLQCHSQKKLMDHRYGKKHKMKMEELKAKNFCKVCNSQCNSGKMFAQHCNGKKHRAKLNAILNK